MRTPSRTWATLLAIALLLPLLALIVRDRPAYSQASSAARSAPFTVANPGANAKAVIFDSGSAGGEPLWARVNLVLVTDVTDATLVVDWYAPGDTANTAYTLPADWPAITANTPFQRDVPLFPGRTRVYLKTVTAPTTWKLGVEVVRNRALAQ